MNSFYRPIRLDHRLEYTPPPMPVVVPQRENPVASWNTTMVKQWLQKVGLGLWVKRRSSVDWWTLKGLALNELCSMLMDRCSGSCIKWNVCRQIRITDCWINTSIVLSRPTWVIFSNSMSNSSDYYSRTFFLYSISTNAHCNHSLQ